MKIRIFCIVVILMMIFGGISFASSSPTDRITTSYYTDEYGNRCKKECRTSQSGYNHGCRYTIIKRAPKSPKKKIVFGDYYHYKKRRDAQKKEKERQERINEAIWKSKHKNSAHCFIGTMMQ